MPKFNQQVAATQPQGKTAPLATTGETGYTHEGHAGYKTDIKTELFRLAVTNMVGEDTFYESGENRDDRFRNLIHAVTAEDPDWMQRFIPYLRNNMFMRSASIVAAAEYVAAGGPNGRGVVASACSRADEPAEMLGYWMLAYGGRENAYPQKAPKLPAAIKRGIADAAVRLYNEYSALKYDGTAHAIRPADVIELTHPKAADAKQAALFKYLLDRRHRGGDAKLTLEQLPKVAKARELDALDRDAFRALLLENPKVLDEAGFTWERLSGKTEMDAKAWEAVIPNMGPMALIRNLRNFDEAKIGESAKAIAKSKITDPELLKGAKLFPFRFWSAFKAAPSLSWGESLEKALGFASQNIPELDGRTLVLIDYSGSMNATLTERSKVARWETGALFGVAQFVRCGRADLVAFGDNAYKIPLSPATDVLRGMQICTEVFQANGFARHSQANQQYPGAERIGHGTQIMDAIKDTYKGHDRIVVFSDMQTFADKGSNPWYGHLGTSGATAFVDSLDVPIYSFDLAGYENVALPAGSDKRYLLAGFSDAAFNMMAILESGNHAGWPWE